MSAPLSWPQAAWIGVVGAAAIWMSFPAVFMLAAIGLAIVASTEAPIRIRRVMRLLAIGATWATSLWGLLSIVTRGPTTSFMQEHWADRFLDFPPGSPAFVAESLSRALSIVSLPFAAPEDQWSSAEKLAALLVGMSALGTWITLRQSRAAAALLVLGPALVLAAAALHIYPLESRLLLFLAPPVIVLASRGMTALAAAGGLPMVLVVAAAASAWPAINALQTLRAPTRREEVRPLPAHYAAAARPDDALYVWRGVGSAAAYYARTEPALLRSDVAVIWGTSDRGAGLGAYAAELQRACGRVRVWVLASHLYPRPAYDALMAELRARAAPLETHSTGRSDLTLFATEPLCRSHGVSGM
jgi:hypothetical protein